MRTSFVTSVISNPCNMWSECLSDTIAIDLKHLLRCQKGLLKGICLPLQKCTWYVIACYYTRTALICIGRCFSPPWVCHWHAQYVPEHSPRPCWLYIQCEVQESIASKANLSLLIDDIIQNQSNHAPIDSCNNYLPSIKFDHWLFRMSSTAVIKHT